MNWAASHLATGRTLREIVQNGSFLLAEEWGGYLAKEKKGLFQDRTSFEGKGLLGVLLCRLLY